MEREDDSKTLPLLPETLRQPPGGRTFPHEYGDAVYACLRSPPRNATQRSALVGWDHILSKFADVAQGEGYPSHADLSPHIEHVYAGLCQYARSVRQGEAMQTALRGGVWVRGTCVLPSQLAVHNTEASFLSEMHDVRGQLLRRVYRRTTAGRAVEDWLRASLRSLPREGTAAAAAVVVAAAAAAVVAPTAGGRATPDILERRNLALVSAIAEVHAVSSASAAGAAATNAEERLRVLRDHLLDILSVPHSSPVAEAGIV
jgi:hypothetical protein